MFLHKKITFFAPSLFLLLLSPLAYPSIELERNDGLVADLTIINNDVKVAIEFKTLAEINVKGFNIWRADGHNTSNMDDDGNFLGTKVNSSPIIPYRTRAQTKEKAPATEYRYIDSDVPINAVNPETGEFTHRFYQYWLEEFEEGEPGVLYGPVFTGTFPLSPGFDPDSDQYNHVTSLRGYCQGLRAPELVLCAVVDIDNSDPD